jgi:hypothetical protein
MTATISVALVGDLIKKGFISESTVAAARANGWKPSRVLATYYPEGDGEHRAFLCRILAPQAEYEELAYNLPDFLDVPIFHLAWQQLGRPTTFIVTCLDDGDQIFIDTQGYDYARYRGGVMDAEEVTLA